MLKVLLPLAFLLASCTSLVAETQPKNETPLAEAVKSFNEMAAKDPIGKQQPPLTEGELVAAIQWWKSQRERMGVGNGADFQAFVKIEATRQLPMGWEIEVLSGLLDDGPFTFEAWSVGLKARPDDHGLVYIFQLPERTVRPRLIGALERKVIEKWQKPEVWHNPGLSETEYYRERQAAAEKDGSTGSAPPNRSGDGLHAKLEDATKTALSAHHFTATEVIHSPNDLVWVVGTRVQCWSGFVIAIAKMTANDGVRVDMAGYQFVGSAWARLGRLFNETTNHEADEIQAQIQEQVNR